MKRVFLLLVVVANFCHIIAQETKLFVFVKDSLDNYIKRGMHAWQIPGLAVAIIKDGEIVFCKGFGVTRTLGKEPVNENTLFMIGSNTKLLYQ